ncbi:uncharacterized protein LOC124167062 isoform X2 [Ischnura elegans]|uniref:uncharacterized protein LOC124167062 isoform X2 n=1 Tax=Ischnura elegans TaxID=197161 RepID=UPI001ED89513|nr:uncharacterized protein LOC124167062 isoform X2 [Ischnura elegans]
MEDIRSKKHRRKYRRETCYSKRELPPERQIPRKHLTQGRITTRPGLFNQGKCTSFVHRALCFSPTKKARMDEDLHRIIQLANGVPVEDEKYVNVSKKHGNIDCNVIPRGCCSRTESVEVCEESSHACENIPWGDSQDNREKDKVSSSRMFCDKLKHSTTSGHEEMETDSIKERSPEKKKGCALSSASTVSTDSPSCSTMKYSPPTLAEYEKFASAAILPLNSKKLLLFPGKDYLEEVRGKIKTMIIQNKNTHRSGTSDAAIQESRMPFEAQSRTSPVVSQGNGMESEMSPIRNQLDLDEFSPYPCILSPKTTILNPIEYLKRVEQANKQKERTFFDSGHGSGQSHGSSLSKSQGESNFSNDLQKSDLLQYSLEPNECCAQSQSIGDNLLYQHSNRSFIDSPQAFKVRDGNFEFPGNQCAHTSVNTNLLYDDLDIRLKNNNPFQRIPSVINTEHDVSGLQYMMDIAEIGHSSDNSHNPNDLLDELDAITCDPRDHSSVVSRRDLRRPITSAKRWGPPPSPPTPEHKFYRRKMF